jgi:glycosyltransferase involved in cell wall biosynthesis
MTMPLPPYLPARATRTGPVDAIVTGYLQPWSRPGDWVRAIRPFLDDGSIRLHVLVSSHWGRASAVPIALPESLAALMRHPGVTEHRPMRFGDFRKLLARCDLSIDVFERNPERELAMVTRSAVALSCGLPVMHVPFTEVGPIIAEQDAGWLVESSDVVAQGEIFGRVVDDPTELEAKQMGAASAAREVFEPATATAGLHELLEELA